MSNIPSRPAVDAEIALAFLRALDPTAQTFNFRTIHDPKDDLDRANTHRKNRDNVALADVPKLMEECARNKWGLFVVVNPGGHRDSDIYGVRALFVDLDRDTFPDDESCHAAMLMVHEGRNLKSDPFVENWPYSSAVVSSGGGGYHVYFFIEDCPPGLFKDAQRALAERFGADRSCVNPSRVMRLPGSLHQKYEPKLVGLKLLKPERRYSLDDLLTRMNVSTSLTPTQRPKRTCSDDAENDPVVSYLIEHEEHLRHGGRRSPNSPIDVVCPNKAAHSEPDSVSSTVYLPQGFNNKPRAFNCFHSHCADLRVRDFLAHIGFEKECPTFHSDDGLACRFAASLNGEVIYSRGQWYVWSGAFWYPDKAGVKAKLKSFADRQHRDVVKQYALAASMNDMAAKAMIATARKLLYERHQADVLKSLANMLRVKPELLDSSNDHLAVPNGCVNLSDGTLLIADPNMYPTHCAGAAYDPSAKCPRWNQFLLEIFRHDHDIINYVQRLIGYCLTGHMREEVMLVGFGSGANGKSVFAEVLRTIFGDYAASADPSLITASRQSAGAATPEVARLSGKRLCLLNESKVGDKLDDGVVKKLVSMEMMVARPLYRDPFEFYPTAKLFLRTNHRPAIRDTTEGLWRRLHMLPFSAHFQVGQRDPRLLDNLRAEKEGILAWAVRGAVAWYRDGLQPPPAVLEATNTFRSDQDTMTEWFYERTQAGGFTASAALMDDYVTYAGLRHAPSAVTFASWLKDQGAQLHRSSKVRGFKISLKPQGNDEFDVS